MSELISNIFYDKKTLKPTCKYLKIIRDSLNFYKIPNSGVWYATECEKIIGTTKGRVTYENKWIYCPNCGNQILED